MRIRREFRACVGAGLSALLVLASCLGWAREVRAGESGFSIQNLAAIAAAVFITYSSGSMEVASVPPGATTQVPIEPGQGSAILQSDQPIVAVANLAGPNGVRTPYVLPNSASVGQPFAALGDASFIAVQNPGAQRTDIGVSYFTSSGSAYHHQDIEPGGPTIVKTPDVPGLPQPWCGSALMTSGSQLAAVACGQTMDGSTMVYQSGPGPMCYMPGYSGQGPISGVASQDGVGSLRMYNQDGSQNGPYWTIPLSGSSCRMGPSPPAGFTGSAVIDASRPLAAVYDVTIGDARVKAQAMGMLNVGPTSVFPWVPYSSPYSSRLYVQNTSPGSASEITVTYTPHAPFPGLAAGEPETVVQTAGPLPPHGTVVIDMSEAGLPDPFLGSALVTATAPVAVMLAVAQGSTGGFAYPGLNPQNQSGTTLYAPLTEVPWLRTPELTVEALSIENGMLNVRWTDLGGGYRYTLEYATGPGQPWSPFPPESIWPLAGTGFGISLNAIPGMRPGDGYRGVLMRVTAQE